MIETYTPSGRCSPVFLTTFLGLAVILGVLGWVYQWLLDLIPLIYVSFILTLGAGFVIWRAVRAAAVSRAWATTTPTSKTRPVGRAFSRWAWRTSHPERSEGSARNRRFFASLRMTE